MRACVSLLLVAASTAAVGCEGGVVTGEATSSEHPTVRSAFSIQDRVTLPDRVGFYYLWRIGLVEDAPGTDCNGTGDPLIVIDVYTLYRSAPRGDIPLSFGDPPPSIFPSVYGGMFDGIFTEGALSLTEASGTGLLGTLEGQANIDTIVPIEIAFDAPNCVL